MKCRSKLENLALVVLIGFLCISCGPEKRQRLAIAFVIDLTGSIEQDAIQEALESLTLLFDNKKLQRGDSIYVIPITGDTLVESQGKILRVHLNEDRQVYDSDLISLAKDVKERLERMQAEAITSPYRHSDILGAADLAAEEISVEKGKVRKVIVILSDFIQDDAKTNFNTCSELANENGATELAKKLSTKGTAEFAGITMHLGFLRSKDLRRMQNTRREAVQAFWKEYFKTEGASTVSFAIDGPGKIPTILAQTE